MHFKRTVGDVVVLGSQHAYLGDIVCSHIDMCTHRVAIGPGPDQPYAEVMVIVHRGVPVENDIIRSVVVDGDIDVAVAVCIEARYAPALSVVDEPDFLGAFIEDDAAGLGVVEKSDRVAAGVLFQKSPGAVDVDDVDPAVVVDVRRTGPPAPAPVRGL